MKATHYMAIKTGLELTMEIEVISIQMVSTTTTWLCMYMVPNYQLIDSLVIDAPANV